MDRQALPGDAWAPSSGSYEEAVLSWFEQVERLYRAGNRGDRRPAAESTQAPGPRPDPDTSSRERS